MNNQKLKKILARRELKNIEIEKIEKQRLLIASMGVVLKINK